MVLSEDRVIVTGFGGSGSNPYSSAGLGTFRVGFNRIAQLDENDNVIVLRGRYDDSTPTPSPPPLFLTSESEEDAKADNAQSRPGDSGSGLFSPNKELLGINSKGGVDISSDAQEYQKGVSKSGHANLTSKFAFDLMGMAIGHGASIPDVKAGADVSGCRVIEFEGNQPRVDLYKASF